MNEEAVLSKSGSPFVPVEKLPSRIKEMPPVINLAIIKAVVITLFQEIGILSGAWILLRAVTYDYLFHHPKWRSEYFKFKDEKEDSQSEPIFKSAFKH